MRVWVHIGEEKLELEDSFFSQYMVENSSIFLEDKMYRVVSVKRVLQKAGKSLDSELQIYLE